MAHTEITEYTEYLQLHGHPKGTVEQYVRYPQRLLDDMSVSPLEVTPELVAKWVGRHPHWKPNTRRRAVASLRQFFTWAVASGRIPESPMALVKPIRGSQGIPRPVPELRLAIALGDTTKESWRWLLTLAAETGLRRSELARVHRDDPEQSGTGWSLRVHGKGDKERLVPISDELAQWIRSHQGWVFPSPIRPGEHVIPSVLGKRIKRALGGEYTAHTMRHRFASVVYDATGDILAVKELLGHESVATTQIYTRIPDARLRAAAATAQLPRVA